MVLAAPQLLLLAAAAAVVVFGAGAVVGDDNGDAPVPCPCVAARSCNGSSSAPDSRAAAEYNDDDYRELGEASLRDLAAPGPRPAPPELSPAGDSSLKDALEVVAGTRATAEVSVLVTTGGTTSPVPGSLVGFTIRTPAPFSGASLVMGSSGTEVLLVEPRALVTQDECCFLSCAFGEGATAPGQPAEEPLVVAHADKKGVCSVAVVVPEGMPAGDLNITAFLLNSPQTALDFPVRVSRSWASTVAISILLLLLAGAAACVVRWDTQRRAADAARLEQMRAAAAAINASEYGGAGFA